MLNSAPIHRCQQLMVRPVDALQCHGDLVGGHLLVNEAAQRRHRDLQLAINGVSCSLRFKC